MYYFSIDESRYTFFFDNLGISESESPTDLLKTGHHRQEVQFLYVGVRYH